MATDDFFRARLDQMIDLAHPLAVLATRMPRQQIEATLAPLFAHKDRAGREVRVALELHCRGDRPDTAAALVGAIEARVAALPPAQAGFRVVTATFLRARAEQRAANTRAILLEYRFRVLAD